MRRIVACAVLLAGAGTVHAEIGGMTAVQLQASCSEYQKSATAPEATRCAAYILGFIDGALAEELGVLMRDSSAESFSDRALRTRLGRSRVNPAAYCLRESTTLEQIVEQVLAYAKERPPAPADGAVVLLNGALQRFHACSRPLP